jgi:hypothetical protein
MVFLEMEIFFVSVNIKYKMGTESSKEQNIDTESECQGYFLTEDIKEYADMLRRKMDFINGDGTSTADKIQEIKTLIEAKVNDNTNTIKGDNNSALHTMQDELDNLKNAIQNKIDTTIENKSIANIAEIKSHVSDKTTQINDELKEILSDIQTSENGITNRDNVKTHVTSDLSTLTDNLLNTLLSKENAKINEESLKSHIIENLQRTAESLISSLQTIDSDGVNNVKEHVTKAIDTMKSALASTIENSMTTQKSGSDPSKDIQFLIAEGNETQRNVKSLFNDMEKKKRDEMDALLGLTTKVSQTVKNNGVIQYLEIDLCEKNLFIGYSGSLCGDMEERYDNISNSIPSCKTYYQSKKNGTDAPMSAACEYSLAKIASACLENEICEKCGTDGSASCRTNCWYVNDRGQSKFGIRPHCESMIESVTTSYKERQYVYSLNRIAQCETKLCKHREISNNMQYAPNVCNLSLDSTGELDNMTSECFNHLDTMYTRYEQDCNESFEEQYNESNVCTANKSMILQPL